MCIRFTTARSEVRMSISQSISPITRSVLQGVGWKPERRVSTIEWQHRLLSDGYKWLDVAQKFLSSFGGLIIHPPKYEDALFGSGMLAIDPLLALGESERIMNREVFIGIDLCPLGEWNGESILLIDHGGRVYAETTYQVLLLGESPIDAIDLIIRAHRYPDVIDGTAWWVKDN